MRISFASISDPGPRPVNEDSLDCWVAESGATIACIADGLGGMGGGDVASRLAINEFRAYLQRYGEGGQEMIDAAYAAHSAIREAQQRGEAQARRMATTLTALSLSEQGLVGIHCGDTRAAIARGRGIKRLTVDHSEGQRLFEAGKLNKEELSAYQRKHILESALGDQHEPRVDHVQFELLAGDRVVLTTDGVHNLVLLREMQRLCATSPNPKALVERVTEAVRGYGPTDNFSIVALFVD